MANVKAIPVEVVYALPDEQFLTRLEVPEGSSAELAIRESGILARFPELDLDSHKIGIFGKLKKPDQVLRVGYRVEIYRPLIADPKVVRKQRAAEGKKMKKGGGSLET